ncbi:hypothetical protein PP707_06200 [Acetobacter pasteurianus]|nr:hypothetical protein [Acetobacter pasteurianus]
MAQKILFPTTTTTTTTNTTTTATTDFVVALYSSTRCNLLHKI